MAKTTNIKKRSTPTTEKKTKTVTGTAKVAVENEQKKITAEAEKKKLTTKPEAKKIAAGKELEKIAAKPEPEKITMAAEPKKIAATVKAEEKKEKAAAPVKTAEKESAVKEPAKEEKKPAAKTKKPAAKKAAVKKETKTAAAKVAEPAVKEEKKAEKPAAKKTAAKKPAAKTAKTTKAAPAKKAVKANPYKDLGVDECIAKMQSMGVGYVYADYARILLDDEDLKNVEKNIIEGNALADKNYTFEKDGFDTDLVMATLEKVADTMDVKALDFKDMKKDMAACVKTVYGEDAEVNAAEYLKEFKLCEKILMVGQRKNIVSAEEVSTLLGGDVEAFVQHFFALAYAILPTWQYEDVKFYEDFAYAVLSQYADLYEKYQLNLLIDCADLYIKHGDFQHGDENYGYILRDNQIKDYIYYRFASVYEDIDFNKAKALAYESLQYVDGRYMYYQNIMDIINK